jgi:hypothetical protein
MFNARRAKHLSTIQFNVGYGQAQRRQYKALYKGINVGDVEPCCIRVNAPLR